MARRRRISPAKSRASKKGWETRRRKELEAKRKAAALFKKRSQAAKKGWIARRPPAPLKKKAPKPALPKKPSKKAIFKKRSEAAKVGWITRKAHLKIYGGYMARSIPALSRAIADLQKERGQRLRDAHRALWLKLGQKLGHEPTWKEGQEEIMKHNPELDFEEAKNLWLFYH